MRADGFFGLLLLELGLVSDVHGAADSHGRDLILLFLALSILLIEEDFVLCIFLNFLILPLVLLDLVDLADIIVLNVGVGAKSVLLDIVVG